MKMSVRQEYIIAAIYRMAKTGKMYNSCISNLLTERANLNQLSSQNLANMWTRGFKNKKSWPGWKLPKGLV